MNINATRDSDRDSDMLGSTVCLLPVEDMGIRKPLPVLLTGKAAGAVTVVMEAFSWARASTYSRNLSTIQSEVETISRFYDFCRAFTYGMTIAEDDLDYLIYAYLLWRLIGTLGNDGQSAIPPLRWKPLSPARLEQEFRALARYFIARQSGWERRVNQDEKRRPDALIIVAGRALGKC